MIGDEFFTLHNVHYRRLIRNYHVLLNSRCQPLPLLVMKRPRRWLTGVGLAALITLPVSGSAGADLVNAAAKPTVQISFSFEGNAVAPKVGQPYSVYVQMIPRAIAGTMSLSIGSSATSHTLVRRVSGNVVIFVVSFSRPGNTTLLAHFVGKSHPTVKAAATAVIRVSP